MPPRDYQIARGATAPRFPVRGAAERREQELDDRAGDLGWQHEVREERERISLLEYEWDEKTCERDTNRAAESSAPEAGERRGSGDLPPVAAPRASGERAEHIDRVPFAATDRDARTQHGPNYSPRSEPARCAGEQRQDAPVEPVIVGDERAWVDLGGEA